MNRPALLLAALLAGCPTASPSDLGGDMAPTPDLVIAYDLAPLLDATAEDLAPGPDLIPPHPCGGDDGGDVWVNCDDDPLDGCEINSSTDPTHCAGCWPCPVGWVCSNGTCGP